jgi:hypothetical protein
MTREADPMTNVTATEPEREVRPAQDLAPGEWIAAGELIDATGPARVLFVHPYLQDGQRWIDVTCEDRAGGAPVAEGFEYDATVRLATESEIAEMQKGGRRVQLVERLRSLADLIERHQLPLAEHWSHLDFHFDNAESIAEVAAKLGVSVAIDSAGRNSVIWNDERLDGPLKVEWFTYVHDAEPEPEAAADPTGLGYSREADDPTPVSPARVPLHTGGMVGPVGGGELVDETEPEPPVHLEIAGAKVMCGLAIIDLDTGHGWTNDHAAVTCKACIDQAPF